MDTAPMFGSQQLPNMKINIRRPLVPDHLKRQCKDEESFWKYHNTNPYVYEKFDHECQRALESGRKEYSSRTIIHYLRHDLNISPKSDDGYKICDHHAKYYGLLWMYNNPDYKEFFKIKKQKDDDESLPMKQQGLF